MYLYGVGPSASSFSYTAVLYSGVVAGGGAGGNCPPPLNVGLSEKMSENVLLVGQFSSKNAKGGLKTPIWGEI